MGDRPEVAPIPPLRYEVFQLLSHAGEFAYPCLSEIGDALMMISTAVVAFQLLTDIMYTWFDPRIRFS